MALDVLTRSKLLRLQPHARRHAEQLLFEVGAPMRISSGLRTPAKNRAVGGARGSYHLRGRAVDLTGDRLTLVRAAGLAWALRVGPGCTGPEEVILENLGEPNQHLHVAW